MDPLTERLTLALAERYSVLGRIGEGGTASVYRATDLRHARDVAIKVLNPDLAASLGIERFLREIQTTAALQHPHILPLFDSGQADGLVFYVTPLVEGMTLRDRVRAGPLPIDEALELTDQVASALSYAHGQGLVHRDVKPANILLSSGRAVLADFGIATALSQAGGTRLTEAGVSIGTPEYMSPEQIEDSAVDARSDLYSLACVTFEMLTGEPPITGRTAQSVFARRLSEPPPSARTRRTSVPEGVDNALTKAMNRQRVDRYSSVDDFIKALAASGSTASTSRNRTPLVVGLGLAAVGVAAVALLLPGVSRTDASGETGAGSGDEEIRFAVYPIENLMGDEEMQNFVDALHVDVIAELQGISTLRVTGRSSSVTAASTSPDLVDFAGSLGVDLVLTGSVFRFGDTVTFRSELVDGQTGVVVKPVVMSGALDEIMAWKSRFVQAVADSTGVEVSAEERERIATNPDVSRRAYALYARAATRDASTPDDIVLNADDLLDAVEIEPDFADAWYRLGTMRILMAHNGVGTPREMIPLALAAADSALAVDPRHGGAISIRAHVAYDFEYDWAKADSLFLESLRRNPSDAAIHQVYGAFLLAVGRYTQSLFHMRRASELDPFFPFWSVSPAWSLTAAGRSEEALRYLDSIPDDFSDIMFGRFMRRLALANLGANEQIVELAEAGRLIPRGFVGAEYALSGRRDAARQIADSLASLRAMGLPVLASQLALAHAGLGDDEDAMDWLWTAYEDRESSLAHIREERAFDRLAGLPRFEALMDSLAFPDTPAGGR